MAVTPNHHLRARTIVGEEQNQGVFRCTHGMELLQDSSYFLVHPVHHRGVNRHLIRLEASLCRIEFFPGNGAVHFIRPQLFQGIRERIRRTDLSLDGGQGAATDSHRLHASPSSLSQRIPPFHITIVVIGA